jgi:hypothetical protein
VLDSYAKSYDLVKGPKTFRIQPRMRHGHAAGWEPQEIGIYIDSVLKAGTPLPQVGPMRVSDDGTVTAEVQSETKIAGAQLYYTVDTGLRSKRDWANVIGEVSNGKVIASGLPKNANTWLMTITDERGAMVTSKSYFAPPK